MGLVGGSICLYVKEAGSKGNLIQLKNKIMHKSRQKQYLIKETFPKAWKKVITEPDDLLVELLADTTEKLCGYKLDNEIIESFLISVSQGTVIQPKKEISAPTQLLSGQISRPLSKGFIGKSIPDKQ